MTRLLASVANRTEAESAIRGGADLIDLKDPARGALGALGPGDIREILAAVAGRRPVSATIGDLPPDPCATDTAIRAIVQTGVDYVKVGFFTHEHVGACLPVIADLAPIQPIVAVLFADRPTARADLKSFAAAGCAGVMLDTADKASGPLLRHLDIGSVRRFVEQAGALGLITGLAGSLRLDDIPELAAVSPSYLGFRGALCREDRRTAGLDPQRLRAVRRALFDAVDRRSGSGGRTAGEVRRPA